MLVNERKYRSALLRGIDHDGQTCPCVYIEYNEDRIRRVLVGIVSNREIPPNYSHTFHLASCISTESIDANRAVLLAAAGSFYKVPRFVNLGLAVGGDIRAFADFEQQLLII